MNSRSSRVGYCVLLLMLISACSSNKGGGGGDGNASSSTTVSTSSSSQQASTPRIAVIVPENVFAGEEPEISVEIEGVDKPEELSFTIENNPDWLSIDPTSGEITAAPGDDDVGSYSEIKVVAEDAEGKTYETTLDPIVIPPPPVIDAFASSRLVLISGESAELSWQSSNTVSAQLTPVGDDVNPSGNTSVSPAETTEYTLTVTSEAGQSISKALTVVVEDFLAVELRASTIQGGAPLTVTFTPIVNTQNAANRVYWDFEGDGGEVDGGLGTGDQGFDQVISLLTGRLIDYDSTSRSQMFIYDTPGTYNARMRLWDALGNQIDSSVQIEVLNVAPSITVVADVTNGEVPLAVTFTVVAEDNEGIASLSWDFDNDGEVDEQGEELTVTHLYETTGEFQAAVTATDLGGVTSAVAAPHISIRAQPEGSPALSVTASPRTGDTPLSVRFTGSATIPSGDTVSEWRYDFDGDGEVDLVSTNRREDFVYNSPGTYYPRIEIITEQGLTALDIEQIQVAPDLNLAIESPTINPLADEQELASIISTLNGSYNVQLDIVDSKSQIVRTIVPWQVRDADTYTDNWDGKSDDGSVLAPGAYFAILRYKIEDQEYALDLRTTTAGQIFYPGACGGVGALSRCGDLEVPDYPLQPFNNQPWVFKFRANFVAEMTANLSIYTTDQLMSTFFTRRPYGTRLESEIVWNGEDANGAILPTVDTRYLINLFGETLGDNAMYLDHGVRLHNMRAEPSIFYPYQKPASVTFDLTRAADIDMWVVNARGGGEVYRTRFPQQAPGESVRLNWNGTNNAGVYLSPGEYRISLVATDEFGHKSIPIHAMQRIRY